MGRRRKGKEEVEEERRGEQTGGGRRKAEEEERRGRRRRRSVAFKSENHSLRFGNKKETKKESNRNLGAAAEGRHPPFVVFSFLFKYFSLVFVISLTQVLIQIICCL